jgi:hypothetical protein
MSLGWFTRKVGVERFTTTTLPTGRESEKKSPPKRAFIS